MSLTVGPPWGTFSRLVPETRHRTYTNSNTQQLHHKATLFGGFCQLWRIRIFPGMHHWPSATRRRRNRPGPLGCPTGVQMRGAGPLASLRPRTTTAPPSRPWSSLFPERGSVRKTKTWGTVLRAPFPYHLRFSRTCLSSARCPSHAPDVDRLRRFYGPPASEGNCGDYVFLPPSLVSLFRFCRRNRSPETFTLTLGRRC